MGVAYIWTFMAMENRRGITKCKFIILNVSQVGLEMKASRISRCKF